MDNANVRTIIQRLSEPSTWAGFAAVMSAFGLTDEEWRAWSSAAVAIFGLLAVVLKEKGSENQKEDV